LEHDYHPDFVVIPTVGAAYTPDEHRTPRTAVSAVAERTLGAISVFIRRKLAGFPAPNVTAALTGSAHCKSEGLTAFETGHRKTVSDFSSSRSATFHNTFDHRQIRRTAQLSSTAHHGARIS
jgi:hypothetical protein